MNRNKSIWGLLLIGAGVLFLLQQMDYISFSYIDYGYLISTYWPVVLILIGLKGILIQIRLGHGWGGSWNVFIALLGTYLLLNNLDMHIVDKISLWQFLVPTMLIVLGLGMLTRGAGYEERKAAAKAQRRQERELRRQEHREERDKRRGYDSRGKHSADPQDPFGAAEAAVPPFDPAFSRKIEQDLDQVFHERVVKKLGDDPFPLVSDMEGKRQEEQDPAPGGTFFRAGQGSASMGGGTDGRFDGTTGSYSYDSSRSTGWEHQSGRKPVERTSFIGDVHLGQDYWQLEPTNISHFIGDTVIDLTKATIPCGETKLNVSAFIGDVKVFVPNDMQVEISASASAFVGELKVMDRYENGIFRNMKYESRHYAEADKKVLLSINMFIGDVLIKRVG